MTNYERQIVQEDNPHFKTTTFEIYERGKHAGGFHLGEVACGGYRPLRDNDKVPTALTDLVIEFDDGQLMVPVKLFGI